MLFESDPGYVNRSKRSKLFLVHAEDVHRGFTVNDTAMICDESQLEEPQLCHCDQRSGNIFNPDLLLWHDLPLSIWIPRVTSETLAAILNVKLAQAVTCFSIEKLPRAELLKPGAWTPC